LSCTNEEAGLFGAYLSYDSGKEIWVRAGKATAAGKGSKPGGFRGRWDEHEKRAKHNDNKDNSFYYDTYPSVESLRSQNRSNMGGVFENLQQFVAAGFLPNDDTAALFERDYAEGGLFLYTEVEKASVLRTNFSGKLGNRKYFDMLVMISLSTESTMYRRVLDLKVVDYDLI